MDGVKISPLKKIDNPKGDIYHALKKSDDAFVSFGEAYFSTVKQGVVKGWKKHSKMVLNLVVPIGAIEFVVYDGQSFLKAELSQNNYQRLTVSPGLWMAFRGVASGESFVLNLASIEHDPEESVNLDLADISYEWD